MTLSTHSGAVVVAMLAAAVGGSGCRASPAPDALFARAEELRLAYDKVASEEAIAKYGAALDAWVQRGEAREAARAAARLGATYEQLGRLEPSVRAFERGVSLALQSGDRLLESEIRSDLGMAHARLSKIDLATTECQAALEVSQRYNSAQNEARALNCLGEVDYHRGDATLAAASYQRAEAVFASLGDRLGRAETLLLLGSALADQNELDTASRLLSEARALWVDLDHRRGQALTDLAIASLRRQGARLRPASGSQQDAARDLTDLRDRFRTAGDAVWEAAALSTLAYTYEEMGDGPRALRHWEDASKLFEAAGLQLAVLEMYIKIGTGYLATDTKVALEWFEKARAQSEASGNDHLRSWALRFIGVAHLASGNAARGREYLEQSLDVQRSVGDPLFRMRTLVDAGRAYQALGDRARAVACFDEALTLSRREGDRGTEARVLYQLAGVSAAQGDLSRARSRVESALAIADSIRTEVESGELRVSYLASVHQFHELHMDVLMRLHAIRPREGLSAKAFEAVERARARSLLDSLTESGVDLRAGVDPELLEREEVLSAAFDDWAARQRNVGEDPSRRAEADRLGDEYRDLEERHSQLEAEIRRRSPHYAGLARPEPLGLADTQRQVLDSGTVLLEYALGEERSYVWAVSHRDYTSVVLPPRGEIERLAARVYERLTARSAAARSGAVPSDVERADSEYWQEAARLSELLVAPVADRIARKRILIVADGLLQYIPFSALPVPAPRPEPTPLLVEHEIVNLPSASVLALLRRETANRARPAKAVAVLADPVFESDDPRLRARRRTGSAASGRPEPTALGGGALRAVRQGTWVVPPRLASTREEAEAIVATVPSGMALKKTDFDASRAAAMSPELSEYRVVHFATHGVFDNDNPGLSGLILSLFDEAGRAQDGFVRLRDIYNLRLPADLVVLSACDTALGRQVKGEGLVGMVRGFFHAGALRVVASLWKVDDEATGALMSRLYVEMLKEQRSPAAALREAQLAMWRDHRWRAPYHWAAFALQGEWR